MRYYTKALLLAVALGSAGCASNTGFASTWRNPSVQSIHFTKVLAVAISNDESFRRRFEDEMAAAIQNNGKAKGIPAYSVFSAAELRDTTVAKAKAVAAGIDGVVTIRVVAVDKEERYVPGPSVTYTGGGIYGGGYAGRPWGYSNFGWTTVSSPGYLVTDKQVQVETHIYSLTEDKLIWAGRSKTVNPGSVAELVDEVGLAVGDELRREGLIAE
jgi:hypothetical protein